MTTVISVENLSKTYRLGQIGSGTFAYDLNVWWAKTRGKPNPMLRVGEKDHGNRDGEEICALKDVSFKVEQGEVLGIIGRNGAGKSTLLKILSRVTAPTSGRIKVKGRIASLLEVGTGFHPDLTGRENIYLNGAILGMSRREIDRKFDEIVDFAEVEKFIDTPVKRYSSGMYVRLAFAVAAHLDPEILIVDEVLAVGDIGFQQKCFNKMGSVADQGRTILFVSHNMTAIRNLCNRAILLESGQITNEGSVDMMIAQYYQRTKHSPLNGLETMIDRSGSGKARFVSARMLDSSGNVINIVRLGQEITLDFVYQSALPIYNPSIYIGVYDLLSQKILFLDSSETGDLPQRLPANGVLRCKIDKIPLVAGIYYLNLAFKEGEDLLDHIPNALEMQIVSGDYYGTGVLKSHSRNILLMHQWGVLDFQSYSGNFPGMSSEA